MSALFTTPLRRDCLAWTAALWAAILVVPTAWVLVTGSIPIWVAPGALMGTALTWAVMTGLLAGARLLVRRRRPPRPLTTPAIVAAAVAGVLVPALVFLGAAAVMMSGACDASGCL